MLDFKAATAGAKVTSTAQHDQPGTVYEDEILDWDCALQTPPPPRRSGRIEVTFRKITIHPTSVPVID